MTDEYISLIKKNIGYPEMCDTLGSLEGQIYENTYRVIVPLRNFSYTFMRQIPKVATLYYLDKARETYIQGDDSIIGVPIGLYLPDRKTAIEFYKPHGNIGISYKEEWVKNDLCRRNHITMIRLLEKKYKDFDNCICLTYLGYSLEILDLLIKQLFTLIRIEADMIHDIFEIERFWEK